MKKIFSILFLIFSLIGCQNKKSISDIEGTEYVLTNTIPGSTITILFTKDRVSGKSGVNNYTALFNLNGNEFTIKNGALTRMMGPKDLMNQEDEYMKDLENAKRLKIDDNSIEIETSNGKKLVFKKQ